MLTFIRYFLGLSQRWPEIPEFFLAIQNSKDNELWHWLGFSFRISEDDILAGETPFMSWRRKFLG